MHRAAGRPMPWRSLLVVYGVILCDAMVVLIIMPFVPRQCRERWEVPQHLVGTATGAILGAFPLSAFLSSFYLGHLSDMYGRKPLLNMGLLAGCGGLISYGLSTNFWWAFASLFVPGLFNSNVSIVRAVCSDLTEPSTQRALAMGHINACFALSRLVSSSAGGFLAVTIDGLYLFDTNPYLLPCALGSLCNALCVFWVAFGLAESHTASRLPVCEDCDDHDNCPSTPTNMERHVSSNSDGDKPARPMGLWCSLGYVARDRLAISLMACFSVAAFASSGIMAGLSLLYALPRDDSGMGFDTTGSGAAYAWMAVVGLVFQLAAFSRVLASLGLYALGWASSLLMGLCLSLFPMWAFFVGALDVASDVRAILLWAGLLPMLALASICLSCSSAAVSAMQSNACARDRQGLVMGLSGSLGSLLRAFGPLVAGAAFSWSPSLAFGLLSGSCLLSLAVFCSIPTRLVLRAV